MRLSQILFPTILSASVLASPLLVLPSPSFSQIGNTTLCLSPSFKISVDTSLPVPQDLHEAINRTLSNVLSTTHQYLSVLGGTEFFPANSTKCSATLNMLVLSLQGGASTFPSIMESAVLPIEDRMGKEGYSLNVPVSGAGTLSSDSALGLFRGLTTFEQLFYAVPTTVTSRQKTSASSLIYIPNAPVSITDKPQFGWRGLLLDTSRHYFSASALLKVLDTMSFVKLNVFHWHIADSQSWPLDLSSHPELAAAAAYSSTSIYTEDTIKQVVAYAGARGIDVVIEIDTPGHTATIGASHPELVACYDSAGWQTFANEPPPGQLRFADPAASELVSDIFESTLKLVSSAYFGTGGDELNTACMYADEATNASLAAKNWTLENALDDFTSKTHATLLKDGRTPVVWEEMVLEHEVPSLSNKTIVLPWISQDHAVNITDQGFRIVHASSDYLYLDCGHGEWITDTGGGNSWCDPFKSWATIYSSVSLYGGLCFAQIVDLTSFDPLTNITANHNLVLGGQVSLWTEQTDEMNLETMLWPRSSALAELLWTGAGSTGFPRDPVEALPRMHDIRYRMVEKGVRAVPLQPHWCAIRPGQFASSVNTMRGFKPMVPGKCDLDS
ncbi:hexosaminidase, partial [Tremellales sp. Uapishka_1]